MTAYLGSDYARLAEDRRSQAKQALQDLERLFVEHKAKRAEVAGRYQEAASELVSALLPALDEACLQRAAGTLAYPSILKWNLVGEREAEKAALAKQIADIDRDPRYLERDLLLAPGVGKLVRALSEQQHFKEPYAALLKKARHPLLGKLLETGYGTDEYQVQWWRLSFYALWEAGDEILERFPDKKDFGELRSELLEARKAALSFDTRINELQREIGAVRALGDTRKECETKLANAEQRWLAEGRQRIGRYLEDWAFKGLPRDAALPADLEGVFKRASGMHAKLEYLDALATEQLESRARQLEEEIAKLDREIMKYRRPKRAYAPVPASAVDRLRSRQAKDHKFYDRYRTTYDTVYVFDRYDRGSLVGDYLWWDAMTDGRIDGDFIPEVREYRHSHPDYAYEASRWHDAEAAAAVAAVAGHDYGSGPGDSRDLDSATLDAS